MVFPTPAELMEMIRVAVSTGSNDFEPVFDVTCVASAIDRLIGRLWASPDAIRSALYPGLAADLATVCRQERDACIETDTPQTRCRVRNASAWFMYGLCGCPDIPETEYCTVEGMAALRTALVEHMAEVGKLSLEHEVVFGARPFPPRFFRGDSAAIKVGDVITVNGGAPFVVAGSHVEYDPQGFGQLVLYGREAPIL